MSKHGAKGKKALLLIAQQNFRDEEYFVPRQVVEKAGLTVKTASPDGGVCVGMLGGKVQADVRIADANPGDYVAVVIVGGGGSRKYLWDSQKLQSLTRSTYEA